MADLFRLDARLERFWSLEETQRGCWIWRGATVKSQRRVVFYGKLKRRGKMWLVHRYVWWLLWGDPGANEVHHKCLNTLCFNPNHLECMSADEHAWVQREMKAYEE